MEHIKRCYLIPVATGIALLFLLRVSLFLDGGSGRGGVIRALSFWPVFHAPVFLIFYIGVADSIFAIINRKTDASTNIDIVFLVILLFTALVSSGLGVMFPFIAIAGFASAFVNGRTATAIVSGIVVLAPAAPFLIFVLDNLNSSLSSVEFWIMLLAFLTGGGTLAVAFITHANKALSKLRTLYLIPLILLAPFQFLMSAEIFSMFSFQIYSSLQINFSFIAEIVPFLTGVSILTGGGFLAFAFIAHSNMELYKKALYSIPLILLAPFLLLLLARWSFAGGDLFTIELALWQLLQLWIVGGCIVMGINRIIYPSDSNINPHKDSLKL